MTSETALELPFDLAMWLDADMRESFEELPYRRRRRFVERIEQAARPEARERRIADAVQMLRDEGSL